MFKLWFPVSLEYGVPGILKSRGKEMRKVLLISLAFLFYTTVQFAYAADVSLEWDPSVSEGVDGYVILNRDYQNEYPETLNTGKIDKPEVVWEKVQELWPEAICVVAGDQTTCTVTVADDRQTAFVALAFGESAVDLNGQVMINFSGYSNEVTHTPEQVELPPPANIQLTDLGDGRVRITWGYTATPSHVGFWVFRKDYEHPYDYGNPTWSGNADARECIIDVTDDREYGFDVVAYGNGVVALDGSFLPVETHGTEVVYTPEEEPIEPPGNFLVRILQAVLDFFEPSSGGSSKL